MKHFPRPGLIVGAVFGTLGLALACLSPDESSEEVSVTVVGIDGAAWRVIDPMLARGELPNFARLVASGVRGSLRSRLPLLSPPVWTSIATGVSRERHGIHHFNNRQGGLASTRDRRVPAIWNLASDAGLRSAVIGWWVTYPAEAIEGVMISERALKTRDGDIRALFSGRLAPPDAGQLTHPPETLSLVQRAFDVPTEDASVAEHVRQIGSMRTEDGAIVHLLEQLRKESGPYRLELLLLRGVDVLSHHLWKFHEPDAAVYSDEERPDTADVERWGGALEDHYLFVDALLGKLIGDRDSSRVVFVLSDHGFEAGHQSYRKGALSGTHKSAAALDGILIASGGPIRGGEAVAGASIFDIAPTLLYLLGLPVADDLEGRVLLDIIDPDWVDANPVRRVSSFRDPEAKTNATMQTPGDSPTDARMLEELRGLGYLE